MAGYGASAKRTIATALALPQSRSRATERLLRDEEPARRKDVLVDARHEGVTPVHGRGKEGHDGDETVVSLLALSVDGCDALVAAGRGAAVRLHLHRQRRLLDGANDTLVKT